MFTVTAQHLDLVVEAHGVLTDLILISAHKTSVKTALNLLSQFVQTPIRVIFSTALDALWLVTQCIPGGSDFCKCLYVSIFATRARGIQVKPLRPGTVLLAAVYGPGGAGSASG